MGSAEKITFHDVPIKVGLMTLYTSEEDLRMAYSVARDSDEPVQSLWISRSRAVHREEVLAVRGSVAERVRVSFIENVTTTTLNEEKNRTVGPFVGKTFEVERKSDNASVAVFDSNGAPVRFGVAAQVAGRYRHLGRAGDANKARFPAGPQRIGQASTEIAQALAAELSRSVTVSQADVRHATLKEIKQVSGGALHGVYQVEMQLVGVANSSQVTMDLKGTLVLRDIDGARMEVRLQGSVASTPDENNKEARRPPTGTGEFRLTQTMAYAEA